MPGFKHQYSATQIRSIVAYIQTLDPPPPEPKPTARATGERRDEYIAKRLRDGASAMEILAEINAPGRFSGDPGTPWSIGCIYTVEKRLGTKKANAAIIAMDKKADAVTKSFQNFGNISVEEFRNVNPVSIMNHTFLIIANPAEALKALTLKTVKAE